MLDLHRLVIAVTASLVVVLAMPAVAEAPQPGVPLAQDRQLVADVLVLMDERLTLMPSVAAAKWQKRQSVTDPVREAAVVSAAVTRAQAMGLAPEPVQALFELQIELARGVQERLIAHWSRDGYDFADPVPDLATGIRPQLDRITERLLQDMYLAAPTLARPDFAVAAGGVGSITLPAARWSDEDRRRIITALAAVRLDSRSTFARARSAGVLRIGTPADYAPFSVASGELVSGADVELSASLAESLGLRPVFVRSSWRTLIDDLTADRFDIAVGGISATPARLKVVGASVPLSRSGKTAVGRCSDRAKYRSLAAIDVPGVTEVENPGGTNESFARSHLSVARIVIHPDNRTVFDEILGARADVMFTDETEIALASHHHPQLCRLLEEAFEPADKVFLYDRAGGWGEVVDPWLSAQVAAGVPKRLLEQFTTQ